MTPVRDRVSFIAHIVNDFRWAIERGVERAELGVPATLSIQTSRREVARAAGPASTGRSTSGRTTGLTKPA